MKVSLYSDLIEQNEGIGWHKDGYNIKYYQNGIRKGIDCLNSFYYTLTFTYTFKYDQDTVFFAYSVPYTYTDLRNDLQLIE